MPYEPGTLEAIGYRAGKTIAKTTIDTTGTPTQIVLASDRPVIRADGEDVANVTVSVLDAQGRPVPTADNPIDFTITGAGRLLGVGNGDPSSHESDKSPHRRLFNGLAMALVQSDRRAGAVTLVARSPGLAETKLAIRTKRSSVRPSIA